MVTVWAATVSVPVRAGPSLVAARYLTVPLPVVLLRLVTVIHGMWLTAVQLVPG